MNKVTREHKAGLELALQAVSSCMIPSRETLIDLIAEASAAPEQETVAWVPCSPEWLKAGGDCATAPRICCAPGQGVSHLHPSHEIARLRADLGEAKGEYDRSTNKVAELRDLLEATSQRADAAEQMLRELLDCPWVIEEATIPKAGIEVAPQQVVGTMHVALVRLRKARALLSASAEPADPKSTDLYRFLGAAAGEGIICGDVDAEDLFFSLYPDACEPAKGGDGEAV